MHVARNLTAPADLDAQGRVFVVEQVGHRAVSVSLVRLEPTSMLGSARSRRRMCVQLLVLLCMVGRLTARRTCARSFWLKPSAQTPGVSSVAASVPCKFITQVDAVAVRRHP